MLNDYYSEEERQTLYNALCYAHENMGNDMELLMEEGSREALEAMQRLIDRLATELGLREDTRPETPLACPECGADLYATGVHEVSAGAEAWTSWNHRGGQWVVTGEARGEGGDSWFECKQCDHRLSEALEQELSAQI